MFLLDTHVISELRKPRADANVVAWAKSVIAHRMFISAITLKELETGVLRMERRDSVGSWPDRGDLQCRRLPIQRRATDQSLD